MVKKQKQKYDEMDLIAKDEFTLCKCLNCGYEQEVPSWLIDEINDINKECNLDDHFVDGCSRCNKDTMVTMKYYQSVKEHK